MWPLVQITKSLSDETRLRCLAALRGRELCLCHLTALLELAPSTISKHLSLLRAAGLLTSWKDGRWVHFRWSTPEESPLAADFLACLGRLFSQDPRLLQDEERLRGILDLPLEDLCRPTREK